jgi:hypothetical protein
LFWRGRRQAQLGYGNQQTSRPAETFFDLERIIQAGIVQHSFPAQRRARLLKIGPHDYQDLFADLILQIL